MEHYFTNSDISSKEVKIKENINGKDYYFITDNGVFSKKHVDYATKFLLETIDLTKITGDVLDLGCGYGPIGIVLKSKTTANVDMVDINLRAINLALKNAKLNKVEVNVYESNLFENINKSYDYIVTNPPIRVGKEILYNLVESSLKHLKDNGILYLVINKNQGAKSLIKNFEKECFIEVINKSKGFYVISCKKQLTYLHD